MYAIKLANDVFYFFCQWRRVNGMLPLRHWWWAKYCDQRVCLSVCSLAFLKHHMLKFSGIFRKSLPVVVELSPPVLKITKLGQYVGSGPSEHSSF